MTKPMDAINKLDEHIKGIRVAMLTTANPDGSLSSRPMACQEIDFDGSLWFFTSKATGKILSIMKDQHVNLAYVSPSDNRYVSVSGRAEIIEDSEKSAELWNPIFKAWFPQGLDDPNLVLIRVDVENAEYWDSPSSTMVKLVGFAKSILTGESYKGGENEKINIQH